MILSYSITARSYFFFSTYFWAAASTFSRSIATIQIAPRLRIRWGTGKARSKVLKRSAQRRLATRMGLHSTKPQLRVAKRKGEDSEERVDPGRENTLSKRIARFYRRCTNLLSGACGCERTRVRRCAPIGALVGAVASCDTRPPAVRAAGYARDPGGRAARGDLGLPSPRAPLPGHDIISPFELLTALSADDRNSSGAWREQPM